MSGENRIIVLNVPGANNAFGESSDVSALNGEKTIVLSGTYTGRIIVFGSHDGTNYTPIVTFDSGSGVQQTKVSKDLILKFIKVRRETQTIQNLNVSLVGQETCSENNFLTFPLIPARAEGAQPSFDTWNLVPDTGISPTGTILAFGKFSGTIVIEGSLDNINFSPVGINEAGSFIGGFTVYPSNNTLPNFSDLPVQLPPLLLVETVRYLRARVDRNTFVQSPITITLGCAKNISCTSASGAVKAFNYAQIRLLNAEASNVVSCYGKISPGDGGQGSFVCVEDILIDNDGTILSGIKSWVRID